MPQEPLDLPADVRSLRREGLLNDAAYDAAEALVRPAAAWIAWARNVLLVLAGIIFFFAFNWSEIGRFTRLGTVSAALLLCFSGALVVGLEKLSGKMLLLAASVLIGVVLAVFGQIYQTGADAYTLFVGWAALMVGWVVAARFAALWLVWLVIAETGFALWFGQEAAPRWKLPDDALVLALGWVNALALALVEFLGRFGLVWLRARWLRFVLWLVTLGLLTFTALTVVFEGLVSQLFGGRQEAFRVWSVPMWLLIVIIGHFVYRRVLAGLRVPGAGGCGAVRGGGLHARQVSLLIIRCSRGFHLRHAGPAHHHRGGRGAAHAVAAVGA